MNLLRSFMIFFMGVFMGNIIQSVIARGYPTMLELLGFVLFPLAATIYARLNYTES